MKHSFALPDPVRTLITRQAGCLSRAQALGLGVPESSLSRLARQGVLDPLTRGIYSAWRPPQPLTWVWAGVLLGGPDAVAGAGTAAWLDGLVQEAAPPWTIFSPRQVRAPGELEIIRGVRAGRGEPSRTLVTDTLLDLWPRTSPNEFVGVLARAFQRRLLTQDRLLAAIEQRTRITRRGELLAIVGDVGQGAESPLEVMYLRNVERAHGLPTGLRQAHLSAGTRTDVYYELGLLVELDGRRYHEDQRFRDMSRDNSLAFVGPTLRYGTYDVSRRPCAVAAQVAEALTRLGWSGTLRPCRRCRR